MKLLERAFLICLLMAATAASAGEIDSGWYAGAKLGQSDSDLNVSNFDDGSISNAAVDNDDSVRGAFGGYQFTKFFAVEGGYIALNNDFDFKNTFNGNSNGTGSIYPAGPISVDLNNPRGYFLAAVGKFPVGKRVELYGKLGVFRWDNNVTANLSGSRFNQQSSGTDRMGGVGVAVSISPRWAVRAEVERYQMSDVAILIGDVNYDVTAVGFEYRFNR